MNNAPKGYGIFSDKDKHGIRRQVSIYLLAVSVALLRDDAR